MTDEAAVTPEHPCRCPAASARGIDGGFAGTYRTPQSGPNVPVILISAYKCSYRAYWLRGVRGRIGVSPVRSRIEYDPHLSFIFTRCFRYGTGYTVKMLADSLESRPAQAAVPVDPYTWSTVCSPECQN